MDIFVVELVAMNPQSNAAVTLRYCTGPGFATKPTDTPASAHIDGRVRQAYALTRSMFAPQTTRGRSATGYGDIVLANDDGLLDGFRNYSFDGRAVTVRRGQLGAAYPAAFTTEFIGTVQGIELTQTEVTVKLRDRQAEMDVPLQPTKYAGTGLGTLEGTSSDLLGKPKPVCFGKVRNVQPPCVETGKLIYQLHDGVIASVDAVYDRGVALGVGATWVQQTTGFGASSIQGVAYGNGLWVAVGTNGHLETSPDAVTWTSRVSTFGAATILHVAYGNGLWVITGGGKIATSPDGITWTAQVPGLADSFQSVAFANGLFVVADTGSNVVLTSTDGITWTQRATGFHSFAVAYGNGLWVIVGGTSIATSPDGITWTTRYTTGNSMSGVAYGAGTWVAIGDTSYVSSDGVNWSVGAPLPFRSSDVASNCLSWCGTCFIVATRVPASAVGAVAVSTDPALSWSLQGAGQLSAIQQSSLGWNGILGFNSLVVIVAFASNPSTCAGSPGTFTTLASLLDDSQAPSPGSYKVYLPGGYVRLGSSPTGVVTADLTEGTTAADRTTAQVFKRLLTRAGKAPADYSAADIAALDAATSAVIGVWVGDETSYADVLDQVAGSPGAAWYIDKGGVFRIKQLAAPSGAPVVSFTANDIKGPLNRVTPNDPQLGIPVYSSVIQHSRNYTVQSTDLAGTVTTERRALLALEWLQAKATDAAVQALHALAQQTVDPTLLTSATDAALEALRRQSLYGVQRDMYQIVVPLNAINDAIEFADAIEIIHARFGLTVTGANNGGLFRVIGIDPDAAKWEITLTLWGGPVANRVTNDGTYRVTDTGVYRIRSAA